MTICRRSPPVRSGVTACAGVVAEPGAPGALPDRPSGLPQLKPQRVLGVVAVEHKDEAPDAYKHFDKREDGWTKVVLKPEVRASTREEKSKRERAHA